MKRLKVLTVKGYDAKKKGRALPKAHAIEMPQSVLAKEVSSRLYGLVDFIVFFYDITFFEVICKQRSVKTKKEMNRKNIKRGK